MRFHTWITLTTLAIVLQACLSGCIIFDSAGNACATTNADGSPPSSFENFLAGAMNVLGDGLVTLGAAAGGLGAAGVAVVKHRRAKRAEDDGAQQSTALIHATSLVDKMREANDVEAQKVIFEQAAKEQVVLGIRNIVQVARVQKV